MCARVHWCLLAQSFSLIIHRYHRQLSATFGDRCARRGAVVASAVGDGGGRKGRATACAVQPGDHVSNGVGIIGIGMFPNNLSLSARISLCVCVCVVCILLNSSRVVSRLPIVRLCVWWHCSQGGRVNAFNDDEHTPLMNAVQRGSLECVHMLINNKAKVHAKDKFGCTALQYAIMNGNEAIAELLLRSGAETDGVDKDGNSLLMVAVSCIARYL